MPLELKNSLSVKLKYKLGGCHFFRLILQKYEDIKQLLCEAEWVAMTTEQMRAHLTKQHFIITTHFMSKNGQGKTPIIKSVYKFPTSLIAFSSPQKNTCNLTDFIQPSNKHETILAASSRRVRKWDDTLQ